MRLWRQLDKDHSPHIIVTERGDYVGNADREVSALNIIRGHNAEVFQQRGQEFTLHDLDNVKRI